jgi:PKHD-type hydroxylase
MRGLYKVIKNLIDPAEAAKIAERIRKEPEGKPDPQVPNSAAHYGLPVCNTLLGLLCEKVSEAVGKKLKPTYSYCRVYRKGNSLAPHKDRPSCEYSVTLNLSQTHPWPIFMGKRSVVQSPGDGCVYRGCDIEHSRGEFKGDEYVQVFLHYVDSEGPYKDYVHDFQNEPKAIDTGPLQFVFARHNPNLLKYYRFSNAFTVDECTALRNSNFELAPGMTEDTKISDIRKSQIYWIPKTTYWEPIYQKIMNLVGQCNKDFYNFDITSLQENLQYTEYDETYQGRYDWHFDVGGAPLNCGRKLSVSIQLSDPSEYEGGELQFSLDGEGVVVAEKTQGTMVIFPSYMKHRVTPVTKGTRRSLVTWITGPPFR